MNIQHVSFLVETIKAGSISSAARHLGKSHSTLSAGISALEDELGLNMLDRSGHKPTLTDDGKRLLPEMMRLLENSIQLRSMADSLIAGVESHVRLVFDSTAPLAPLLEVADPVVRKNPSTEFRFDVSFGRAEDEVMEQKANFGLAMRTRSLHASSGYVSLQANRWGYYCRHDHPLLEHAPNISREHLNKYPHVVMDEVRRATTALRQPGSRTLYTNTPLSAYFLLVKKLGFAMMPEYVAGMLPDLGLVKFTPIDLPTDLEISSCLVWNDSINHGPIVRQLIARAQELYSGQG